IIGVTYGSGDGSTTFNLPDLRGRVIAGLDNMGGTSANRVTDASADSIGGAMGAETHTLTASQIPNNALNLDNQIGGVSSRGLSGHTGSASQAHNNMQPTLFMNYIIKT
ncbi:MAG: tail fiber protein, partial [Chloroflexi bacterium]